MRYRVETVARFRIEPRQSASVDNLRPRAIYVTIEDAAEVDARENAPNRPMTADARARELLLSHCTEDQRAEWQRYLNMHITASTGVNYILDCRRAIRQTDAHEFCLQIVGESVPIEDAVLMRKLLIETNEPEFLRLANDLTDAAWNQARAHEINDRATQRTVDGLITRMIDRFLP